MEEVQVRSTLLNADLKLDFFNYDEKFYEVIDRLFTLHFGKEAAEIIFYYVYERINSEGEEANELLDQNDNVIPLNSPSDLWILVNHIKNKTSKVKKK